MGLDACGNRYRKEFLPGILNGHGHGMMCIEVAVLHVWVGNSGIRACGKT